MSKNKKEHIFWSSVVLVIFIGCGVLLYLSYIYEGHFLTSCENCSDIDSLNTQQAEKLTQEECQNICHSKECVVAANFILENMDESIDPCEDFYSFSCGNWMKQFSKDDNYSVVDGMGKTLKLAIRDILDNLKGPPESAIDKLKIMYDSCMNERSSDWKGVSSTIKFLEQCGIQNWQNLPLDFEFREFSLNNTLASMAAYNEFAFIIFKPTYYEPDEQISNDNMLKLTISPGYPLMRDESDSKIYENMILQILRHFGIRGENSNQAWMDFKSIDISILKLHMDTIEKMNYGEEDSEPLEHLDCSTETQNFTIHLCTILEKFVDFSNISHQYSKKYAYAERFHFVQNVFPVITNFTHSSVANYLALRYIIAHLDDLSHFFRVLKLSHPDMIPLNADHKIGLSKWEHCTEWISRYMSYPLGQVYVRKRLSEKHMEDIRGIVRTFIQDAGYYILKQRWMKKNMRKKFVTSIENLKNSIEHYVNFLRNGTKFSFYMEDFHPQNVSFLENAMDYRKLTFRFYLLNFRALEDEDFPTDPFIVNAYHSPGILDLRFGIFLPPVYQYGRPRLLNIATMGTTIGHELGHEIVAFLEDPENFENDTLQIYNEKKKCLEDQYSNFDVKKIGQKVKGKQTIHENLADLIGIEITQQIITRFLQRGNGNRFLLPALDFSTEQILYVSLAQMWCSVSSKEKEQLHHDRDVHAPSDIRITGILRNLREFSEAFGCIPGSHMNPIDRCAFRLRS